MDVTAHQLNQHLDMTYGYDSSFDSQSDLETAAEESLESFETVKDIICNEWIDSDLLSAHVKAIYAAVEHGNNADIIIMATSLRNSMFDAALAREAKA